MSFLEFDWMLRALAAGALVGLAGPSIGIYLVQRHLSLLGDGIGHVAFTGIAAGLLMNVSPIFIGVLFAAAGAIAIELMRERNKVASDVALALIFYGGIAGAVLLISLGNTSTINLNSYLFGSVLTVGTEDLWLITGLAAVVLILTAGLRKRFFAIAYDEEVARASGLRVRPLNLTIAVMTAITIGVAAKVVGILLVSSMLVLPVAAAQQLAQSFRSTLRASLLIGVAVTWGGLVAAFYLDVAPAATIVLSAIAVFILSSAAQKVTS